MHGSSRESCSFENSCSLFTELINPKRVVISSIFTALGKNPIASDVMFNYFRQHALDIFHSGYFHDFLGAMLATWQTQSRLDQVIYTLPFLKLTPRKLLVCDCKFLLAMRLLKNPTHAYASLYLDHYVHMCIQLSTRIYLFIYLFINVLVFLYGRLFIC